MSLPGGAHRLAVVLACASVWADAVDLLSRNTVPPPLVPAEFAAKFLAIRNPVAPADGDAAPTWTAGEQFGMRCAVSFASKTVERAPLKSLADFCSSGTDSAVECKMVVVDGLKTAVEDAMSHHDNPSSSKAFVQWCDKVWSWFQVKYGQYCLNQCHKLQCEDTCSWMKERERLDDIDVEKAEAEYELQQKQKQLGKDQRQVERMKDEVNRLKIKVGSASRNADFDAKEQQEDQWNLGNATAKLNAATQKVEDAEDDIRGLRQNASAAETTVMGARHNQSMAESKRDFVGKNVSKLTSEQQALSEKKKSAQAAKDNQLVEIEAVKKMITDDEAKVEARREKIVAHNATLREKEAKYDAQKVAYDADVAGGTVSAKMLAIKKKSLEERRQQVVAAESKGRSMTFEMERMQQTVSLSGRKVASMEKKITDRTDPDIASIQAELDATIAQLTEAQAAFSTAEADVSQKGSNKDLAEQDLEKVLNDQSTAKKTMPFLEREREQRLAKKRELTKQLLDSRQAAQTSAVKLWKGRKKLNETDQEYNATATEAEARDRRLSEQAANLTKTRKELQDVRWAHERKKPLIVEHHELVRPLR